MMIDKYHRTHKEFMETPFEVIQTILLKRESDSKADKKKKNSLQIKKR
jgi:phosphopantetheine adenylyltransferase